MSEQLQKKISGIYGGNVLDVASGIGEFIQFIKEFKDITSITAIDIVGRYEKHIRDKYPDDKIDFQQMNAADMKFHNCSFDTVCISNSLHHFEKPQLVLSEMVRVLNPDGTIILNEMFADRLSPAQGSHKKMHHWFAKIDRNAGKVHNKTYTADQLFEIVTSAGLVNIDVLEYCWNVDETAQKDLANQMFLRIDSMINSLEQSEGNQKLIDEGHSVKKYADEFGFAPASSVFITANIK